MWKNLWGETSWGRNKRQPVHINWLNTGTRTLTLFNNVCRQEENSIERQCAVRLLTMKENSSACWFIAVKAFYTSFNYPHHWDCWKVLLLSCIGKKLLKQLYTNSVKSKLNKEFRFIPVFDIVNVKTLLLVFAMISCQ